MFKKSTANLILKINLRKGEILRLFLSLVSNSTIKGCLDKVNLFTEHQDYNKFEMNQNSDTKQIHQSNSNFKQLPILLILSQNMLFQILVLTALLHIGHNKPDLQIGAGGFGFGCGSNSPAAQVPYSFVRLGPDTAPLFKKQYFEFQHFGGYSTADHYIRAFSHLHLVGAGVLDMGIFGILPMKGYDKKPTIPGDEKILFFKESEYAEPGYYKVDLQDSTRVQLTTTQRTGAHRYTFNQKRAHYINVMTSYLLDKKGKRNSTTQSCGSKCLEGSVQVMSGFGGRFGGYKVHFHLQWVSDSSDQVFLFNKTNIDESMKKAEGEWTGAVIQTYSSKLQIFIGISYVSIQNAKLNLYTQVSQYNFEKIKKQALSTWAQQFSRFQVSTINTKYQTEFDTALYRTMLSPTLFNDVNRQYMSFKNDGSVSIVPSDMEAIYTDMSIWDVHRTQMPWILFHDLYRFNDIAKSILMFNREGGYMPKWPFANGWTGCMIGAHANTVLSDWIIKQAYKKQENNLTEVLSYMLRNANTKTPHDNRPNVDQYKQLGYIAFQGQTRSSVSQTLQLSFNDFSISQVAKLLNLTDIKEDFLNRSRFYKNLWNSQTQFFEPKSKNGSFIGLSDKDRINIFSNHYVEGNAWHYRFAVPHDAQGLIQLFGGEKSFLKELKKFFTYSKYWPTFWLPNPYYWAGNEHDLFSVWLFSFANRPDLTAKFSRMIMNTQYGTQGDGLPGNDDYATMSAWYVFAALGFYPLPSTQTYILGSPVISSATIYRRMDKNKLVPLHIQVQQNKANIYEVQSVNINSRQLKKFITHTDLSQSNAVLTFVMK